MEMDPIEKGLLERLEHLRMLRKLQACRCKTPHIQPKTVCYGLSSNREGAGGCAVPTYSRSYPCFILHLPYTLTTSFWLLQLLMYNNY